ncbi:MAG: heavy metal-binding domain-containing protein, partial [Bacteroidota bacterium]
MKKPIIILSVTFLIAAAGCNRNKDTHDGHKNEVALQMYTCPMPQDSVFSDKAGKCPKCGMNLVKKETGGERSSEVELEALLKPTNEFVVSSIPVTVMYKKEEQIEIEALGNITYDMRQTGSISSRIAG